MKERDRIYCQGLQGECRSGRLALRTQQLREEMAFLRQSSQGAEELW